MAQAERLNLARKYRPSDLRSVLGQPMAVKVLEGAILNDRIAPAYLFSGPRGSGKTTCARIFARAASCLSSDLTKRPCNECASCVAQLNGQSMDLTEMDGASHTGVDDVRQIIESVAYRPTVGRRSVFIIDEVHMLSNAAFNALLKTLEEPPPHALFLFATTELEKIPATILSRVQRVEMKRLSENVIVENLLSICDSEKIRCARVILEQVAAAADGSLRDAQTLFEQIVLLSGSKTVDAEVVDSFLGTIGIDKEIEILELIANQDLKSSLVKAAEFYQQGKDLVSLCSRLLGWIRALLLMKSTGSKELITDLNPEYLERLDKTFQAWSIEDVDRLFEIFWLGSERIRKSELPRISLESTLIRAGRITLTEDLKTILQALAHAPISNTAPISSGAPIPNAAPIKAPAAAPKYTPWPAKAAEPKVVEPTTFTPATNASELLEALKKKRPSLYSIVSCAETNEWKGDTLSLSFPSGHFAYRQLSEKILLKELQDLTSELSSGKCKKVTVAESGKKAEPPTKKSGDFMKEAKKTAVGNSAVQKAAKFLDAQIESVTIEGIKTP